MPVGDLDVLPGVLVEKILLLLDLEALLAAASTCKGFCSLLIGRGGECLRLDEAKTKASRLFSEPFNLSKRDLLRSTTLARNNMFGSFGAKGASVLSQALLVGALPKLEQLSLYSNQMGDEGCKALAEHLPTSLKTLDLGGRNQIGDEGCKALAEHLPKSLEQLSLDDNQIGDEGCKALAEHLPTSLELLLLHDNQIGDEGCKALAEHLPTSLKELYLGGSNQIGDEGCKALAEHLPTSLERLGLADNQIGDEGCKALAEHLPTSLRWLGMGFDYPTLRAACEERGITYSETLY
jgi:Ran GTPase-activating protein (RanGAP) involved in mRNA processing and transport